MLSKEMLSIETKEIRLTIDNAEISAIKKLETIKTGLRVYGDGKIGISNAVGPFDEDKLFQKAKKMLDYNIPYSLEPTRNISKSLDFSKQLDISEDCFIEQTSALLELLRTSYPNISFSHVIKCTEKRIVLSNELNTRLEYIDHIAEVDLRIKYKTSNNSRDNGFVSFYRNYDINKLYKVISKICENYNTPVEIDSDSKIPVIIPILPEMKFMFILDYLKEHLNGKLYGEGASRFYGKIGQKLFGENFTLYADRDPQRIYNCFFDGEGTILENNKYPLIENGVLKAPYSSKMDSQKYNLPLTSTSSLDYNTIPATTCPPLTIMPSEKTLNELLGGSKAVFAVISSGGSFTSDGEYASPVQVASLFENGKIIGKLPQISISSNVYNMFGKDFIGVCSDNPFGMGGYQYMVVNMDVKKIGNHI